LADKILGRKKFWRNLEPTVDFFLDFWLEFFGTIREVEKYKLQKIEIKKK